MAVVDGRLQGPTFVREDARGTFIEVANSGPWETVITGSMRAGAVIGNHYHKQTRMFLFLLSGSARVDVVTVADGTRASSRLSANEGLHLLPHEAHAVRFLEDSTFLLLKSRRYEPDHPDTYPYVVPNADES